MRRNGKILMVLLLLVLICSNGVSAEVISYKDKLEDEIYNHMINRDSTFNFIYPSNSAINLLQDAAKRDDYLERSIAVYTTKKSGYYYEADIQYRTTKEQEEYIDSELSRIVNNLIDNRMSTVDKVKTVNDYIVKIYKYDDTLKSDNVYSALTTKTTVCQGYAMTAYKMFKILGIDCRIINGDKSGVRHAWNLVKINDKWYQLDCTNNDNIVRDKYLLKSDSYMRENGFKWDNTQYPTADENYFSQKTEYIDYNNDKETDILQYYEGGYWYKDNMSKWHYKRNSGYEAIGWFKYDNNWYYLGDDGIMKTGWVNIDNNWRYFYLDGKLAVSTTIDGYNLNENGEVY